MKNTESNLRTIVNDNEKDVNGQSENKEKNMQNNQKDSQKNNVVTIGGDESKTVEQKQSAEPLSAYAELKKNLDDRFWAYKFYQAQFARAKEIVGDILSVTTGNSVITEEGQDSEWGHGDLLELLAIFQIRHENFDREQFAEDLQTYIFTWSITHDEANRVWQTKLFAERNLDESGTPLQILRELSSVPTPPEPADEQALKQAA